MVIGSERPQKLTSEEHRMRANTAFMGYLEKNPNLSGSLGYQGSWIEEAFSLLTIPPNMHTREGHGGIVWTPREGRNDLMVITRPTQKGVYELIATNRAPLDETHPDTLKIYLHKPIDNLDADQLASMTLAQGIVPGLLRFLGLSPEVKYANWESPNTVCAIFDSQYYLPSALRYEVYRTLPSFNDGKGPLDGFGRMYAR